MRDTTSEMSEMSETRWFVSFHGEEQTRDERRQGETRRDSRDRSSIERRLEKQEPTRRDYRDKRRWLQQQRATCPSATNQSTNPNNTHPEHTVHKPPTADTRSRTRHHKRGQTTTLIFNLSPHIQADRRTRPFKAMQATYPNPWPHYHNNKNSSISFRPFSFLSSPFPLLM